jgi:glycosyltransferase involved in cell wall biosynthesis
MNGFQLSSLSRDRLKKTSYGLSLSPVITIGIDYTAAVHQSAGIGRYTRELVKALAAHPGNSFNPQFRLFVADGDNRAPDLLLPGSNFSWHTTRLTKRWLERLWYRLHLPVRIEAWTGHLDLFHQPDFVLPPVRQGTPTLLTVHDLSFVQEPDSVMPGMTRHLNRWVPWSVARADHVIAVSEATRQDLIELYGTSPEKISVLYHGVTTDFKPIKDRNTLTAVRQKYGLSNRPFILSLGTVQPRKNYRRLVQAFAQLDPLYTLVIAGRKGWGVEGILADVEKLGLAERVHFPDFVADDDLPALYSAASLFAYPSLYEGFGLPVLEAMACGTPVVASKRSSLPEVVGEAGLLVDPLDVTAIADAMAQVLADEDLHQRLSQSGHRQAAKFSWGETAAKLVELYQELLMKAKLSQH